MLNACNLEIVDPEYPDLVILPKNPEVALSDYCIRSGDNLLVNVKNIGLSNSDVSTTSVDFYTRLSTGDFIHLQTIAKPTPGIVAGETISLQFKIPNNCFDPDCEFSIIIDSENNISENNENNNGVTGTCKD